MIRSWRNSATRKVWAGEQPNQLRGLDFETTIDLLLALNVAKSLHDQSAQERRAAQAQRWPKRSVGDDGQRALANLFWVSQRRCPRSWDCRLPQRI